MDGGNEVIGPELVPPPAVEALLGRARLAPRRRERLEMVKAAALGDAVAAIAAWSGRTPRTVRRWPAAFAAGGVESLADAPHPGRPPKAAAASLAALAAAAEAAPRDLGLPSAGWTSARLSAYLAEQTGAAVAPGWLRVLLHRRRFACGRVTHGRGHRQDPAEAAAGEQALAAAGGQGGRRSGAQRAAL
jgi:transposase